MSIEIIDNRSPETVEVKELRVRDTFILNDELCIRIQPFDNDQLNDNEVLVVSLKDGMCFIIDYHCEPVEIVNLKCTII